MTIYQPLQVKRSNIPNHKPASLAEGEIAANVKDGILFLGLEDNTVVKFYNSTNFYDEDAQFDSNVSNGDVVYKGSDGKYYQALADGSEKSNVVGIADVTNNRVISQGFISTSYSFNINDKVYLSQDTPGAMTNTPTIVNLGIYLGNGVILIAGRGGGSGEGLPYKSKLTLSSTYTVPNDYGVVVPEKFEVEDGGELVIEENGVFMIVDNDQPEKVYAFDSERLGNIPAADYFNYEGATKYSTLNDAVEAVGSANKDLLIKGNVTVDSDLTIPENVNLVFARNGKITVNSGVTLTINGGIHAGLWQIFDGNGTITGNPKIEAVYPEWFGAKGDGVTDDTEAIQRAINLIRDSSLWGDSLEGIGKKVSLSAKIYRILETLIIDQHTITSIEGVSPIATKIKYDGNDTALLISGVSGNSLHAFSLKNLSIEGNLDAGIGLKLEYVIRQVVLERVSVSSFTTTLIDITNTSNMITLKDCRLYNPDHSDWYANSAKGLSLTLNSEQIWVYGTSVRGCKTGIYIGGYNNGFSIFGGDIHGNVTGFSIYNPNTDSDSLNSCINIQGVYFENNGHDIKVAGENYTLNILGNTFSSTHGLDQTYGNGNTTYSYMIELSGLIGGNILGNDIRKSSLDFLYCGSTVKEVYVGKQSFQPTFTGTKFYIDSSSTVFGYTSNTDSEKFIHKGSIQCNKNIKILNTLDSVLQIGSYSLWVDSNGRLRIMSGTPSDLDTDGTIVGTQS